MPAIDDFARRLFVPVAEGVSLVDLTTQDDIRRARDHSAIAVTVAPDIATIARFVIEKSTGELPLYELHVDATLPPKSWHAGRPREIVSAAG